MTCSSVKPIPMFIMLSMLVREAPTFEDMPDPLKVAPPGPGGVGRVGAGAGASAGAGVDAGGGDALAGKAVVVRGPLGLLLFNEPAGGPLSCGLI